jgi:hypothetical protein
VLQTLHYDPFERLYHSPVPTLSTRTGVNPRTHGATPSPTRRSEAQVLGKLKAKLLSSASLSPASVGSGGSTPRSAAVAAKAAARSTPAPVAKRSSPAAKPKSLGPRVSSPLKSKSAVARPFSADPAAHAPPAVAAAPAPPPSARPVTAHYALATKSSAARTAPDAGAGQRSRSVSPLQPNVFEPVASVSLADAPFWLSSHASQRRIQEEVRRDTHPPTPREQAPAPLKRLPSPSARRDPSPAAAGLVRAQSVGPTRRDSSPAVRRDPTPTSAAARASPAFARETEQADPLGSALLRRKSQHQHQHPAPHTPPSVRAKEIGGASPAAVLSPRVAMVPPRMAGPDVRPVVVADLTSPRARTPGTGGVSGAVQAAGLSVPEPATRQRSVSLTLMDSIPPAASDLAPDDDAPVGISGA